MAAADAETATDGLSKYAAALIVAATAALLALPAVIIGGQNDGADSGSILALAVLIVTAAFGRAAYRGTLPRPFNGSPALFLLALFAAVCVMSVSWSLLPGVTYFDSVRVIGYTAIVAGAALAAQLIPHRSREIVGGLGVAAIIICGYALVSRIAPGWFPATDNFARLRMPFEYWNAVGAVGAFGFIAALWAGTQREGSRWVEIASYPAGGIALVTLMLSQSRGALLGGLIALAVWLLVVPRRLRSSGWLTAVIVLGGAVVAWAYRQPALSTDKVELALRKDTGTTFAVVLMLMVLALVAAGFAITWRRGEKALTSPQRFAIGRVLLIALALSPIVLFGGIAVKADNGLGAIGDGVSNLFDSSTLAPPANSPDRLTQTSSLRARYWSDSWKIFEQHKLHGTGSDTYSVARLPFRHDTIEVLHAHGFVPQVMSDLGLIGLAIILLLTIVWLIAAFKLAGAARRAPTHWLEGAGDRRLAEIALMLVALAFGIQSAIDWTWFVPGVAIFGLVTAGWVLGSPAAHGGAAPTVIEEGSRWRTVRAVAVALVGLSVAFAVYQPVLAKRKVESGYTLVDSDPARALVLGRDAHEIDPTSADPFFLVSVAQNNLDEPKAADATLVTVATEQPGNPDTWLRLAAYRLNNEDPEGAIVALRPLLYQSPNNDRGLVLMAEAREMRVDQLIDRAADKERRRLQREIEKIEKQLAEQGIEAP